MYRLFYDRTEFNGSHALTDVNCFLVVGHDFFRLYFTNTIFFS